MFFLRPSDDDRRFETAAGLRKARAFRVSLAPSSIDASSVSRIAGARASRLGSLGTGQTRPPCPPRRPRPPGWSPPEASIEGLRAVVVALAASRGASAGGGAKSKSGGGTGDANDRLEALHTEASLLFLDLRAANRATLESVELRPARRRARPRALDDQRLLLQNVQYEKGHVRKEIRTSSEFVSEFPDEKVGLCDAETFFAEMATNVEFPFRTTRNVT